MRLRVCFKAACIVIPVGALAGSTPKTLREAADRAGIAIGAAVRPSLLLSEPPYAETVAREFNMVEPGKCDEMVGRTAWPRF